LGCTVLEGAIPDTPDDYIIHQGVQVDVLNVLGAGDALMSGFLRGWLRDENAKTCTAYANACGALVVSRHGCSPATPTEEELFYYLKHSDDIPRPDQDDALNQLHRVTTRVPASRDEICALAFDHRKQFYDMALECAADPARIKPLKQLLVKAVEKAIESTGLEPHKAGVLIDDTYGQDALNDVTGRGWWIGRPLEVPSSRPIELEGGRSVGSRLINWPIEHVVKCLMFYHPDDKPALCAQQELQMVELFNACKVSGHQLLLELIPPADSKIDDDTTTRSLERLYDLGVRPDWWKLPSQSNASWEMLSKLIEARDPHCQGVVLLGLAASMDSVKRGFEVAAKHTICKGFTVGRTLFAEPGEQWFRNEMDDQQLIEAVAANYAELIGSWRQHRH